MKERQFKIVIFLCGVPLLNVHASQSLKSSCYHQSIHFSPDVAEQSIFATVFNSQVATMSIRLNKYESSNRKLQIMPNRVQRACASCFCFLIFFSDSTISAVQYFLSIFTLPFLVLLRQLQKGSRNKHFTYQPMYR